MANFTMEIREMMNQPLIDGIFTFNYDFYSDSKQDKEMFEKLFINHFYFREIGFETPDRFKMKLQAKLNLIMPYYRQLALTEWDKVRNVEQMMTSKNLTETSEHTQTIKGNNESQSNQTTASNGSNTSSSNTSQSTTSNNKTIASNLSDGVSQSSLTDGYLTSSGKSEQSDTIESESSGTSNQSISGNANQTVSGNNEQQLSEKTTFTSKGDIGIQTPAYAITEWRKVIININQMIIDECEDLFMKLY